MYGNRWFSVHLLEWSEHHDWGYDLHSGEISYPINRDLIDFPYFSVLCVIPTPTVS